jgi:hypothetical protein
LIDSVGELSACALSAAERRMRAKNDKREGGCAREKERERRRSLVFFLLDAARR